MDTIQNKVVLQEAWALFKQKGGFLILVLLITVGINSALSFLFPMLAEGGFISQLLSIVQAVVSAILTLGISYILLRVVRGQSVSITDLFSQYDARMVGIYLVSSILFSLIVVFGTLLVIIPGIIWAITFMFTTYFVVDKKTGILASLRESKKLTKGYRMQLFLFMLALIGINILGFMALLIGLFVSVTVSSLAVAIMYTKLLAQSEKSAGIVAEPIVAEPVVAEVVTA